jgi:hypothetical protein
VCAEDRKPLIFRDPTVWSETSWPRLASAPVIRSYPQPKFSRAICTIRASTSALLGFANYSGRPRESQNPLPLAPLGIRSAIICEPQ